MKITLSEKIEGYELEADYRTPNKGEWIIHPIDDAIVQCGLDGYRKSIILIPEKWKPKENENFWYINRALKPDYGVASSDIIVQEIISSGNCFKTKEECELAIRKVKEVLK